MSEDVEENDTMIKVTDAYIDEESAHRMTKQDLQAWQLAYENAIKENSHLRQLLDTSLAYVQHQHDCSWNLPVDVRVDHANRKLPACTCGLDEWGEQTKHATGFYDD